MGVTRVRVWAFQRAVANFGLAIGMLFAGVALAYDTRAGYLAMILGNAATFFVAAYYIMQLPDMPPLPVAAGTSREPMTIVLNDHHFLLASALNGLFWIHVTVMSVGLPLWVIDHTRTTVVGGGAAGRQHVDGHRPAGSL